jgi:hypothetical protein
MQVSNRLSVKNRLTTTDCIIDLIRLNTSKSRKMIIFVALLTTFNVRLGQCLKLSRVRNKTIQ